MPLHTDHRPLFLDDVIGNRETVQALKIHLKKDRPNRSLLFVGQSGCGKTTLAYCVAKGLGAL
jgi:DNA polymerase III gamma/tau subunit